jgi:cytochrome bd-type quinol oxidase subunit 1
MAFFPWLALLRYLANTAGWILTEVGRLLCMVYGFIRAEEAVAGMPNVTPAMLWTTLSCARDNFRMVRPEAATEEIG